MAETVKTTRCLLCSLACPLALDTSSIGSSGEVLTEYVADDVVTQGRLCYRGHYLAEMATHPLRLTAAALGGAPVSLAKAIAEIAAALHRAGVSAALVVDGNLATEDIVSALLLGKRVVGTDLVAVYLPATDAAMLRGLAPDVPLLSLEALGRCRAFLVVGDAFATHPVLSRLVLEARQERKAPLFAMDCLPNHVSGFAHQFLRVRPGGEAAALAAICRLAGAPLAPESAWAEGQSASALAAMAGLDEPALRPVADTLRRSAPAALLLAPVAGRMANVRAAAAATSSLASACGGQVLPLFNYGNAVGAARAASAVGARTLEAMMDAVRQGKVSVLLALGLDLLRVLPEADAEVLRARVGLLAVGAAFYGRSTAAAWAVVPLAMWFEGEGSIFAAGGARLAVGAAIPPPSGALSARALCERLASEMGAVLPPAPNLDGFNVFVGEPTVPVLPEVGEAGLKLVAKADVPDFHAGEISRALAWPRHLEPEPEVCLGPAEARAQGLARGAKVIVRASGREAAARVRIASDIPAGMATISAAFPETRSLFARRTLAGEPELLPVEAGLSQEAH